MIDEDGAGFVEAFTAAVRPSEARGRPGRLMLMFAFAVAFAMALGSLLNGAFGAGGTSGTTGVGGNGGQTGLIPGMAGTAFGSIAPRTTTTAAPSPPAWTAVAGPTCTGSGTTFTETGFYNGSADPAADWGSSASGGYAGAGCAGGFVSIPLSGNAKEFDSGRYVVWTFDLGADFTAHRACSLATYVPNESDPSLVGGDLAYYFYYAHPYSNSLTPLGGYAVNQGEDHGSWVPDTSFEATDRDVSVRLVDAGADQGSASPAPRVAAAQIRLSCSAT